jgi:hypothetical protein
VRATRPAATTAAGADANAAIPTREGSGRGHAERSAERRERRVSDR